MAQLPAGAFEHGDVGGLVGEAVDWCDGVSNQDRARSACAEQ
ncbi:hypothetical protein [Rhodococcus qingshengii]|nr:hypothetical protein [Rhodococcus qingshengii]MCT6736587.1 hypothetical protein [Rhodococcus qingshengii]